MESLPLEVGETRIRLGPQHTAYDWGHGVGSGKLDLESRLVSSTELTPKFSVSSGKVPAKLKRPKFRNTRFNTPDAHML
jgi:hypothetical protein